MISFGTTDIGKKRSINQDNLFFRDEPIGNLPNLYIVADGMGGHKAGDFASAYAIEHFVEFVKECPQKHPVAIMKEGITRINQGMIVEGRCHEELYGMGTTFVCATIIDKKLYVANVGDSRLYVVNSGEIKQITLDHSLVEELIRTGQLDPLKVRNHPEKNIITRAIGVDNCVIPDFFERELQEKTKVLLCSDGLSNMVEDDELLDIISSTEEIGIIVSTLIQRANYYGGKDNIAALVVAQ